MECASAEQKRELDLYSYDEISDSGADDKQTPYSAAKPVPLQAEDSHEGGDSDVDADIPHALGPRTSSERRRAQNDILKAFAADINSHITQKEVDEAASKSLNEEQLSIRDILAKQETAVRIINPRDYQIELYERAKKEDVIAVLDTGSGKTHIATLLLKHVLDEELRDRAAGKTHKVAFFLVSPLQL